MLLFIADLHLEADRPGLSRLFRQFIAMCRHRRPDALYILGDFAEAWIGDDAIDAALMADVDALAGLVEGGTAVHLMHGNRDFLMGEAFAERIGAQLHRDDTITLDVDEHRLVLLHGDTLCTDDQAYQAMRRQLRAADWQQAFLAQDVPAREAMARSLRQQSRDASRQKNEAIMDVSGDAVNALFASSGAHWMIHGHTHRPADHWVDDEPSGRRRLVVGDWHDDHAQYGCVEAGELSLLTFHG